MAADDPAIAELVDQLGALDTALKKVEVDSNKAKTALGGLGQIAGTAVDPQIHAAAQQLVGLDYNLGAVSLHAPQAAEGVARVGASAGAATDRTKTLNDRLTEAAHAFNEAYTAATTIAAQFDAFANTVARLASEQAQLTANSARLGLDFDAAAEAAGRFTDETEAMAAATRLAESGIRLSQNELNSLTRVAAAFAQNTGVTTREAIDTLTQGLITGSERGLRPFGGELARAGGEAHTITDRLAALATQAGHTTQATDDAATSFARFKDAIEDSQRTLASGFAEGITEMQAAARAAREASGETDSWTDHLRELGQAAGVVAAFIAASFNLAFEAVRYTAREIGSEVTLLANMIAHPTQAGSLRAGMAATRAENRRDLDAAVAQMGALGLFDERGRRTAAPGAAPATSRGAVDMVFTTEELASGRPARGGSRAAPNDSANAARLQSQFDLVRQQQALADAFVAMIRAAAEAARGRPIEGFDAVNGRIGTRDPAQSVAQRFAGVTERRTEADAQISIGRTATGDERTTQGLGGTSFLRNDRIANEAARERVTILREQREALAALNTEAEASENLARASGAPESEVNSLMRQRLEIQRALAQSTAELREAQDAQSVSLGDFADKMKGALGSTADAFGDAAVAAAEGSKGFGASMEDMLRSTLKALLKMSIVEGLKNVALGIGHLASFNYPGAASAFAAAGAWAAVGVAAGVGTAALAKPAATAGAGSAPSGTGSGVGARPDSAARPDRRESGPLVLNIAVSGAIFETRHEVLQGLARGMTEARVHGFLPRLD